MSDIVAFSAVTPADAERVGGKGVGLGELTAAGLPVPPGFCVVAAAHRRNRGRLPTDDPPLAEAIRTALRELGPGPVAVRSSATAEDGSAASFAGQQETYLGVVGEDAVLEAVGKCWASLDGDRAVAYRRQQQIDDAGLAMGVVVQRLVAADVAGVLFTRDPADLAGGPMLVEASWGLGESVVSGRVTPDGFRLDHVTGSVLARTLGTKATTWTATGPEEVSADRRAAFCLTDEQLAALADLGRRIESHFGGPRDVEWAFADGRFWLLQARPITAGHDAESVRRAEIDRLRGLAHPRGTVWSQFNVPEGMPTPTPMTWALFDSRLMAGGGGTGRMFRDLGFTPAADLADRSGYDLVAGRVYNNLSRSPRMSFGDAPLEYPFADLRKDPAKAQSPTPVPVPLRDGLSSIWSCFKAMWGMASLPARATELARTFPARFRTDILPAFQADGREADAIDLRDIPAAGVVTFFERWATRTLVEFAAESLKPTFLATFLLETVRATLAGRLGAERTAAAINELQLGVRPDPEADLPGALHDLAGGRLTRDEFLTRFGHRGPQDMELASPRWSEVPDALSRTLAHPAPPAERDWRAILGGVAAEAKLSPRTADAVAADVERLRSAIVLRETAKHHLMAGYARIRRALVELDRRAGLHGGVFFLTPAELPALAAGESFAGVIAERRKRRALLLGLEVPAAVFSDDLDAIGRPAPEPAHGEGWRGLGLSGGVAEGPALVLTEPGPPPPEPFILVCPSTDPAWVPLFGAARGLVMETGGVLSHGAIVAREYGLPAVGGVAGAVRQLRTGQRLRVDGNRGIVTVLGEG